MRNLLNRPSRRVTSLLASGLASLLLITPGLASAGQAGDRRIRVHVSAAVADSEFVDNKAKEREDAARDIRERIEKKKNKDLTLVQDPAQADIQVVVTDRFLRDTDRVEATTTATASTNKQGDSAYGTSNTSSRVIQEYVVAATLSVGTHTEPLEGTVPDTYLLGGVWRAAANGVADGIEKFAKNNRDRLIARRSK